MSNWKIKMPNYTKPEEGKSPPVIIMLIEYLNNRFDFRRNIVLQQVEYKPIYQEKWQLIDDQLVSSLCIEAKSKGVTLSKDIVHDLFKSSYITKFNPIKEYFDNLPEWDGTDYIKMLANTVQAQDEKAWHFYLEKWTVSMVKAAYFKKIVNQQMLVFYGRQGVGKTRWFMRFLPDSLKDYLFTGYTKLEDQMFPAKLSRYLILFLDEMDTYAGKMQAIIKSAITQEVIKIRPLFSCFDQCFPRIGSFAATINEEKFLSDLSGNRRYLVVEILDINHEHEVPMDMVFAQAFALARDENYRHYMNSEEIKAIEERNDQFRIKSDAEQLITQYYEVCEPGELGARYMSTTQILNSFKTKSELIIRCSTNTIGSIMKQLGFIRTHTGTGNLKRAAWLVKERD